MYFNILINKVLDVTKVDKYTIRFQRSCSHTHTVLEPTAVHRLPVFMI